MPPYSTLASPSATRAVLDAHGLSTKKSLGQHFLVNDAIVGKILELADVQPGDKLLEVGPGVGTLTVALLAAGADVLAIERDPALPAVLAETCAEWDGHFTLLQMDALEVAPEHLAALSASETAQPSQSAQPALPPHSSWPATFEQSASFVPTKFVANLPYAVAATLVLDYFERFPTLEQATVMVQAEAADRMMAQPGSKDYGAYTVKLALYAQPAGRFKVGPGNFFPPPRVDSAVIRLNRVGSGLSSEERAAAATMADAAFANRRKTLVNSCKTYFAGIQHLPFVGQSASGSASPSQTTTLTGAQVVEALPAILEAAGIDPSVRGETLTTTDFITLGRALMDCKKD